VRLLQTDLAHVARDRRLRDRAPRFPEGVEELELAADAPPRDHALDQALALGLVQPAVGEVHAASIDIQV
jgi:hypothetical protein